MMIRLAERFCGSAAWARESGLLTVAPPVF
jgi:hypothetical protein